MKRPPRTGRIVFQTSVLCMIVLAGGGCGKSQKFGTVSGKVSLAGKPLANGNVNAVWQGDKVGKTGTPIMEVAGGSIGQDGSYTIEKIPAGVSVKLEVRTFQPNFRKLATSGDIPPDEQKVVEEQMKYVKVPDKYAAAAQSGLTVEVKEGQNVFNIDMTP